LGFRVLRFLGLIFLLALISDFDLDYCKYMGFEGSWFGGFGLNVLVLGFGFRFFSIECFGFWCLGFVFNFGLEISGFRFLIFGFKFHVFWIVFLVLVMVFRFLIF